MATVQPVQPSAASQAWDAHAPCANRVPTHPHRCRSHHPSIVLDIVLTCDDGAVQVWLAQPSANGLDWVAPTATKETTLPFRPGPISYADIGAALRARDRDRRPQLTNVRTPRAADGDGDLDMVALACSDAATATAPGTVHSTVVVG